MRVKRQLTSRFTQTFSFELWLHCRCFLASLFCLGLICIEPAYSETADQSEIVIKEGTNRTELANSDSLVRMSFNQSMVGTLLGSADDEIVWSNEYFDGEINIRINRLRRLDTGKNVSLTSSSPFAFDFIEGHSVMGKLVDVQESKIAIESEAVGIVTLPLSSLSRIRRLNLPQERILNAFQGTVLGSQTNSDNDWKVSGNVLTATAKGAIWHESFEPTNKVRFDVRLTWDATPNFEILFFDHQPRVVISKELPRIEVWDRKLVATQQTTSHADVTKLWEFDDADAELDLTIYVDSTSNRLSVFTKTGSYLGSIATRFSEPEGIRGIGFINHSPQTSVQSFLVSKWDGKLPFGTGQDRSEPDHIEATGTLAGVSADKKTIQVRDPDGKVDNILIERLSNFIQTQSTTSQNDEPKQSKLTSPELVHLLVADGSQFIGRLVKSVSSKLNLMIQEGAQTISVDTIDVVSLRPVTLTETIPTTGVRLLMPGVDLYGSIADLAETRPKSRIHFDSSVFSHSVGIQEFAHGSIYFNRTSIQPQATTWRSPIPNRPLGLVPNAKLPTESNPAISPYRTPEDLQLRSGDILDASVQTIDQNGVTIQSTLTEKTFIPHHAIRSVELKNPFRGKEIDRKKMERLLTVPRMQKEFPPTHLLITVQGDYHRGKLVTLTEDSADFEEGLVTLKIPRNVISVIVWLHDREWEKSEETTHVVDPKTFHLHVKTRSKSRFTLEPIRYENSRLYGRSQLLGEVTIPLSDIETIEFGKDIQSRLEKTSENPWRLDLAKSPVVFDEAASPTSSGMELGNSPLVGKPAPNFELQQLDGAKWRLGDQKGKIIVLDFWASWCGPCMHGMPLVEAIVKERNREDCIWVGVNIEESDIRARTAIERLGIQSPILLDEFGGVAKEYQARAIPLTVIIDRDGIVRHTFVGADDSSLEGIQKALESLN